MQARFLSVPQAHRQLSDAGLVVTEWTVRSWCRKGYVGRKVGGAYRIAAAELAAIIDGTHPRLCQGGAR